jgi:hypothetical protein
VVIPSWATALAKADSAQYGTSSNVVCDQRGAKLMPWTCPGFVEG